MSERRGSFRGIYSCLLTDRDYRTLSPSARLMLLTVRTSPETGPACIFVYNRHVLAEHTGLSLKGVEKALIELEMGRWIVREENVLWIRNGLRFDPYLSSPTHHEGHRQAVMNAVGALPRLAIVTSYLKYNRLDQPPRRLSRATPPGSPPATPPGSRHPGGQQKRNRTEPEQKEKETLEPDISSQPESPSKAEIEMQQILDACKLEHPEEDLADQQRRAVKIYMARHSPLGR